MRALMASRAGVPVPPVSNALKDENDSKCFQGASVQPQAASGTNSCVFLIKSFRSRRNPRRRVARSHCSTELCGGSSGKPLCGVNL